MSVSGFAEQNLYTQNSAEWYAIQADREFEMLNDTSEKLKYRQNAAALWARMTAESLDAADNSAWFDLAIEELRLRGLYNVLSPVSRFDGMGMYISSDGLNDSRVLKPHQVAGSATEFMDLLRDGIEPELPIPEIEP